MHYPCIACITIDSVMKMEKNESSACLIRRMQIKIKKIKMSKVTNTELESE